MRNLIIALALLLYSCSATQNTDVKTFEVQWVYEPTGAEVITYDVSVEDVQMMHKDDRYRIIDVRE